MTIKTEFFGRGMRTLCIALLATIISAQAWTASAEEFHAGRFDSCCKDTCFDPCEDESDLICSYGPHPCEPRGTLLQWSYGTSFSGGPDRDEPLVTDRPDFTEAASTVGLGVAQLEMGYTYTFDNDGTTATKTHSYPETLLRYGMFAEWFELRVAWNYAVQETGQVRRSGAADLYLGVKLGLTPQEGILPEMALIPQMNVPTGARVFTADETQPGLNWNYAWELNDCIATGGSTQFNRALDEMTAAAFTEWAQSWTIAYTLTDRFGAYTEWYAFFPHSADTALPEHYFNGGFTYLVSNDVQWDIRAGVGLNDRSDDYFIGSGLSVRYW
ncbi:MAG: transporter [Pirellulales bacterium]|nr:transporter [Pirellulales bacterium]